MNDSILINVKFIFVKINKKDKFYFKQEAKVSSKKNRNAYVGCICKC